MKAFFSDTFVLPLPDHHRFPMAKYRLLRERLIAEAVLTAADLEIPDPIPWEDLRLVHEAAYVDAVEAGTLSADAQRRIGLFIDYYNFQRPHRGADGLVPADRYFGAASEVKRTLEARVSAQALELARTGLPKKPFYLTGQVGGKPFSVHAEGERVILTGAGGTRQEVELVPADEPKPNTEVQWPESVCPVGVVSGGAEEGFEEPLPPGQSALDEGLRQFGEELNARKEVGP